MRTRLAALVLAAVAAVGGATVVSGAAAGAQEPPATVAVIHGLPDVIADVYVNGTLTLERFEPETVTDPLELPPGDYAIDLRDPGAPPTAAPILSGAASVTSGENVTVIAHLDPDGKPTISAFENDVEPTPAGVGRLVVRHTAAAPAVDVLADGEPVVDDLGPGEEHASRVAAGNVPLSVAAAGSTDPAVGPVDLPITAGQSTIVFVIGSLDGDTLDAAIQTIDVGEQEGAGTAVEGATLDAAGSDMAVPQGVPSGDSGLAARSGSTFPTGVALAAAGLALVGITVSGRGLLRNGRRA
jgi:hypothetical protein